MSDLLSSTLGAVGQVGDTLDKYTGGRAIRGALAGKPRELASIIPFSDSLGITDKHDATSGRSLLDHYGITQAGDDSLGANAAGFLADNVLSPGNWLGAGAAFKAAPTIAKGVQAGAKALSGLDLIDHAAAGAKGLANAGKNFLKNDAGSLRVPDLHSALMAHMGLARHSGSGITDALARANPAGDLPWNRAVQIGNESGVPTSFVDPTLAHYDLIARGANPSKTDQILAWYDDAAHHISLNGETPMWSNHFAMQNNMQRRGPTGDNWFSSSHPDTIIHHELGHAMHRDALGPDEFRNSPLFTKPMYDEDSKYLRKNVSQYASANGHEAIAEIVSALMGGRQFDSYAQRGITEMLHNYGGNKLWNMLGDKKLLKPLGYSMLAGAAGANMIPQES